MKIQSFTCPHVFPNLYVFHSSAEDYGEHCGPKKHWTPLTKTKYVFHRRTSHTVFEQHDYECTTLFIFGWTVFKLFVSGLVWMASVNSCTVWCYIAVSPSSFRFQSITLCLYIIFTTQTLSNSKHQTSRPFQMPSHPPSHFCALWSIWFYSNTKAHILGEWWICTMYSLQKS